MNTRRYRKDLSYSLHMILYLISAPLVMASLLACEEDFRVDPVELDRGSIGALEDIGTERDMRRGLVDFTPSLDDASPQDQAPVVEPDVAVDMELTEPDMETPEPDMESAELDMELDMEVIEPDMELDMEVIDPDMELDMEVIDPDMELDMEVVEPDMEMIEPDMEPIGLELESLCQRIPPDIAEERCAEGRCDLDPRWHDPDGDVGDDQEPEDAMLGIGVCQGEPLDEPIEAPERSVCDVEERRVECAGQGVCFDPIEATALDDAAGNNHDGVCLTAHPILTEREERDIFLGRGQGALYQVLSSANSTLSITASGACSVDDEVSLLIARRDEDAWLVRDLASSSAQPDQACPSLSIELENNILTYVLVRRGAVTGTIDDTSLLELNLTIELSAPDRDGDGVSDAEDCEPDNPEIPGETEILNNGLDDDCNPLTVDTESAVGEACDRALFGLGCEHPSICLQGEVDGVGICGEANASFEELNLNDRCDVYELENQCVFLEQLCFDGAVRGLVGFDDASTPESRATRDGDGICVQLLDVFTESGITPVSVEAGTMMAVRFFFAEPSSLTLSLEQGAEPCSPTPELKVFTMEQSDIGQFVPTYQGGSGAESARADTDPPRCAELSVAEVSDEVVLLISEADQALSILGALSWSSIPLAP